MAVTAKKLPVPAESGYTAIGLAIAAMVCISQCLLRLFVLMTSPSIAHSVREIQVRAQKLPHLDSELECHWSWVGCTTSILPHCDDHWRTVGFNVLQYMHSFVQS